MGDHRQRAGEGRGAGLARRCGSAASGGPPAGHHRADDRAAPGGGGRVRPRAAGRRLAPAPEPPDLRRQPSGRRRRRAVPHDVRRLRRVRRRGGGSRRGCGGDRHGRCGSALGASGLATAGRAGNHRWVPGTGADVLAPRRPCLRLQLLPGAEHGDPRGGLVQDLAGVEPARLRLHVRSDVLLAGRSLRAGRVGLHAALHRVVRVDVHGDASPLRRS